MNKLVLLALALLTAPLVNAEVKILETSSKEVTAKNVDRAALQSRQSAAKKLKSLLKKYRGTHREPILLMRLAETYQQTASIQFRIAHASSYGQKSQPALGSFESAHRQSIRYLTQVIKSYPKYAEIPKAFSMRGISNDEIGNKRSARKDFLFLVSHHPQAPESIPAYMTLAGYATESSRHREAIKYLEAVEKNPWSPHYPYALHKLAWSHYNLSQHQEATDYLKKHIGYYDQKREKNKKLLSSDLAVRTNSLMDFVLFYFEGVEQKKFDFNRSYDEFFDLEKQEPFGKMVLRFAKLLRSRNYDQKLSYWKNQLLEKDIHRPETLEVALIAFDHAFNRQNFKLIQNGAQDLVLVRQKNDFKIPPKTYQSAQLSMLKVAKKLREWTLKNKQSKQVKTLSQTLASVYLAFTQFVPESDPRIPDVHYNLAETYFQIDEFKKATIHYRWVVEHADKKSKNLRSASLKAIGSRYQLFKRTAIVPKDLQLADWSDNSDSELPANIAQWIEWIDRYRSQYGQKEPDFQSIMLEANRTLYAQNKISDSVDRMAEFSQRFPESSFAQTSASLVLDTYIHNNDWKKTNEVAEQFSGLKWSKPFKKQMAKIASRSFFKLVQNSSQDTDNADQTLDLAKEFIKKYPRSQELAQATLIAAQSAEKIKEDDLAVAFYTRVIKGFSSNKKQFKSYKVAVLSRAEIHERLYQFAQSAKDYRTYVDIEKSIQSKEKNKIRKKILYYSWLSNQNKLLEKNLKIKSMCPAQLKNTCDQYRALLALSSKPNSKKIKVAIKRSLKGPKENRALWALVALQGVDQIDFRDKLLMVRIISYHWSKLDPIIQLSLTPTINHSVPITLTKSREFVKKYGKVKKISESTISRRVRLIQDFENTTMRAIKIPWAQVKAAALNQLAQAYVDFANELHGKADSSEIVQKITLPFEEKGQELRRQAFEVASQTAVIEPHFGTIRDQFFNDNPSQAAALSLRLKKTYPHPLNVELANRLAGRHAQKNFDQIDEDSQLGGQWRLAIKNKNWPQAAFFVREMREKDLLDQVGLSTLEAVSLAKLGAQSEALLKLEDLIDDLKGPAKSHGLYVLLSYYFYSHARNKTKSLVEDIQDASKDKRILSSYNHNVEIQTIAHAAAWTDADISEANKKELANEADQSLVIADR